ncbi:ribbon-helix-helix protein, CopG family [Pseudomonas sp. UBA7530]|uniref:ribbon-helix-helix protein, CopG family n=1 Tax=Pseudomonas sp. UBA7530 TaxID=1947341 RepID=UPI003AF1ADA1
MRITADQKRQIVAAYQQQGLGKELGKMIVQTSPPEVLNYVLLQIREGRRLPIPDPHGPGRLLGVDQFNAAKESSSLAPRQESSPDVPRKEAKSVLFSFKVGSDDLDALRALSDRDGESVAVLLRQAIRAYLINRGVKR